MCRYVLSYVCSFTFSVPKDKFYRQSEDILGSEDVLADLHNFKEAFESHTWLRLELGLGGANRVRIKGWQMCVSHMV